MARVRPDDQRRNYLRAGRMISAWPCFKSGPMISAGPAVIKGFDQLRAPALARFMFMIFSRMDLMEEAASPEPEP